MSDSKKSIFKNYRFYLSLLITFGIFALAIIFKDSFFRIWIAVKDFVISIAYYFSQLFFIDNGLVVTVNDLVVFPGSTTIIPPSSETIIPVTYDLFAIKMSMYWNSLINNQTMAKFLVAVINQVAIFFRWFLIFIPGFIALYIWYKNIFTANQKDYFLDSIQLSRWKKIKANVITPVFNWIVDFNSFVLGHKYFWIIWICCFGLYFNLFSIVIDFFAYYFYFVVSFDFENIYIQFYKLFLDLKVMFNTIPWPVWVVLIMILFDKIRKNKAYDSLDHHEFMNRGFINECGQSTFVVGEPGTGKTTALTDMALSQEVMFREKSLELLIKAESEFPNFPFIKLEKMLQSEYKNGSIFSLSSSALFSRDLTNAFFDFYKKGEFEECSRLLFDYDFNTYGLRFDDGSKIIDFISKVDAEHSVLEMYCKLYFIYVLQSSMIVSNYAVRSDNSFQDMGNLPLWNYDFFRSPSAYSSDKENSKVSHILDWDCLRLGKKMLKDNSKANAFEFGVIVITEIGKERGNQNDTRSLKKTADETNQLNDQVNNFLKLVRHSATVDNFPFIKIFWDDQRPESFGADGRDLCEKLVHIKEKSSPKTKLWLFRLESIIFDFLNGHFKSFYKRYRYWRSDNTLFSYFIQNFSSQIYKYYIRLFNIFCYSEQRIESESSKMNNDFDSSKYYLSYKKIYSYRFATDAFSDYFYKKAALSKVGIDSLPSFNCYRASLNELSSEHSYLFNSLLGPVLHSSKPSESVAARRVSRATFPPRDEQDKDQQDRSQQHGYNSG